MDECRKMLLYRKMLFIGKDPKLVTNKEYYVRVYMSQSPTIFSDKLVLSVYVKVAEPEKTIFYESLEEYKSSWCDILGKEMRQVEIHFSSGNVMIAKADDEALAKMKESSFITPVALLREDGSKVVVNMALVERYAVV